MYMYEMTSNSCHRVLDHMDSNFFLKETYEKKWYLKTAFPVFVI